MFDVDWDILDDWATGSGVTIGGGTAGGGTITVGGVTITIGSGTTARQAVVQITNAVERQLQANMDDFRAGRKTAGSAANSFDSIWNAYTTEMLKYGTEGTRALADRKIGGKFDWFAAYRPAGVSLPTGGTTGTWTGTTQADAAGFGNAAMLGVAGLAAYLLWGRR